jgi:hypothetical protein
MMRTWKDHYRADPRAAEIAARARTIAAEARAREAALRAARHDLDPRGGVPRRAAPVPAAAPPPASAWKMGAAVSES